MSNIKVSFIIPAYNVEKYIKECIDGVLAQKIEKEIIIVNDGSTDKTLEVVQKYADSNSCIRIINKSNKGLSCARNDGASKACGEFLCFLDGDDYYLCDFASRFYELCQRYRLDIIRGWYGRVYDNGRYEKVVHSVSFINKPMSSYAYLAASVYQHAMEVVVVTGFIRRDYYMKHGLSFPEGMYYEDQLFYLEMLLSSTKCKVMQVNDCFYGYRNTEGSITSTPNIRKLNDLCEIIKKQAYFVDGLAMKSYYRIAANRVISRTMCHLISLYLRLSHDNQRITKHTVPYRLRLRALRYSNSSRDYMKILIFILSPKLLNKIFLGYSEKIKQT